MLSLVFDDTQSPSTFNASATGGFCTNYQSTTGEFRCREIGSLFSGLVPIYSGEIGWAYEQSAVFTCVGGGATPWIVQVSGSGPTKDEYENNISDGREFEPVFSTAVKYWPF